MSVVSPFLAGATIVRPALAGAVGVAVLAVLVSGCGKDFCERSAEVSEECGQEVSSEDLKECRDLIDNCSPDDQKLLNDAFDCFEEAGLITCAADEGDTGTEGIPEDLGPLLGCVLPLQSLSQECQGELVITSGT